MALQGWASVFAGSLLVLRLDAVSYARTATALEVCVLPTIQVWSQQRRLLHMEGASDLALVTASLGPIAQRAAAPPPPGARILAEHFVTT
ncbi:MAG: hypothetical protein ABIO70_01085 [Pseudomonadota bacterium]